MASSTGLQFTVKVGALPPECFAVADFTLQEQLSQPFILQLALASPRADIATAQVLEQPCELVIWYQGKLQRRICGVVSEFTQGESGFRRTRYRLTVQPALWRLGLRHNSRIFQAKKPEEILAILLQEAGIQDYAFALRNQHQPREYCVQYRETDLAFMQRLLAEEGMCYYHEFEAGHHRLIVNDDAGLLPRGPALPFYRADQGLEQGAYVREFSLTQRVRPARVELKDYSFKTPAYRLSHQQEARELQQREEYQHFDYPGRFKQDGSGQAFTRYRLESLRADASEASGRGNCAQLQPGLRFTLSGHANPACNRDWQIVTIHHTGTQPQALEEEGGSGATVYYHHFTAIPGKQSWRPGPPDKPRVDGPQIAMVVGPGGEEIYCDEHGRVKLQFPWDRYGSANDQSSCWVRVSQGWAGGQYGLLAIPRVGHEVIVSFLEGDPDQPIVTGRTFHATNRPPYELPRHKSRTVLRTETHQGSGFNELRFEDQAGQEEIYLHGQRDLNAEIRHDASWHIGHDEHREIDNQRFTRIRKVPGKNNVPPSLGNDHLTVEGEKRDHIQGDYSLSVDGSLHQKLGQAWLAEAGQEVHIKSGQKLVLEAGSELTLKVGGSFIKLDASGITLVGGAIKLNSGGSPGNGSGWAGKLPGLPGGITNPAAPEAVALISATPTEQTEAAQVKESNPSTFYLFSE